MEASDKAEGFRADIARANESARQAEARAAEANLELARFKAPRSISAQQQASASGQIRPFAPIRIDVLIVGQTMEINNIANSVLALIRTGGWTIGNFGSPMGGLAATGISVATHMNASAVEERAANGLVAALRSVGLDAGRTAQYGDGLPAALTGTWDMSNTAHVRIVIGAKP